MRRLPQLLLLLVIGLQLGMAHAQSVQRVGASYAIKTIAAAAAQAVDGDTFEVEAGDYAGDVAVWERNNITVRALNGRVRLLASGMAAEGKGIWVLRGGAMTVQGLDFSGARVPDLNGAAIRLEKGRLTVRDCSFTNNQNGILTSNNAQVELDIANSEFAHNGHGDGQSHNLYVGEIAKLTVTGSYFHHARVGHLLKSRAAVNHILYNRLTDEVGASASYELEFASGGVAYVIGNLIQQGSQTENPHLISFGAEGYRGTQNELYLINNTLVDDRMGGGIFLRVKPGKVRIKAYNNLLVGRGKLETAGPGDYRNNINVGWEVFELATRQDYRLKPKASALSPVVDAGFANDVALMPSREYVHPLQTRSVAATKLQIGGLHSFKP
jgi:hypothetical protein